MPHATEFLADRLRGRVVASSLPYIAPLLAQIVELTNYVEDRNVLLRRSEQAECVRVAFLDGGCGGAIPLSSRITCGTDFVVNRQLSEGGGDPLDEVAAGGDGVWQRREDPLHFGHELGI